MRESKEKWTISNCSESIINVRTLFFDGLRNELGRQGEWIGVYESIDNRYQLDGDNEILYSYTFIEEELLTLDQIETKLMEEWRIEYKDSPFRIEYAHTQDLLRDEGIDWVVYDLGKVTGNYLNNKPHGVWKFYWRGGRLMTIGEYEHGNRIGEWKFYRHNNNGNEADVVKQFN